MRLTLATRMVAAQFLRDPAAPLYGQRVVDLTKLRPGTVYPLLGRMADEGWLSDTWENPEDRTTGRPLRRYFCLTSAGLKMAQAMATDPQARL